MGAVIFLRRERDSAGLAAVAISVPFQGGLQRKESSPRPDGRSGCFGILRPVSKLPVRRIPKQPGACAQGCFPCLCGEDENRKSSPVPSRRLWKAFIINAIF
jgi:hypothetical protein